MKLHSLVSLFTLLILTYLVARILWTTLHGA